MKQILLPNEVMLGEVCRLLSEGSSVIILTKGSSMLPFIVGDRDSVVLERRDSLSVGEIALAQLPGGIYVLHRIVALDGDAVTLRGDGNLRGVEHCRRQDVHGTVSCIQKAGGRQVNCRGKWFRFCSGCWGVLPRIVRRIFLGLYRRMI